MPYTLPHLTFETLCIFIRAPGWSARLGALRESYKRGRSLVLQIFSWQVNSGPRTGSLHIVDGGRWLFGTFLVDI
jgi:hypothetical protein